jgi:hypothetical protein
MGGRTSLNADQARRQAGEELEHLPAPDLAPDQHLTRGADGTVKLA